MNINGSKKLIKTLAVSILFVAVYFSLTNVIAAAGSGVSPYSPGLTPEDTGFVDSGFLVFSGVVSWVLGGIFMINNALVTSRM